MKKIEVRGLKVSWLTHSWVLPIAYIFIAMIGPVFGEKPNYSFIILAVTWTLIVFMNRMSTQKWLYKSNYILEFGNSELVCKYKDSMIWHIQYSRLSHVVVEPANSSLFNPKSALTLIHTKDGDSYSIPVQICSAQNIEIQSAIESLVA